MTGRDARELNMGDGALSAANAGASPTHPGALPVVESDNEWFP